MAHHGVMAGDELDELYGVKPEEFTVLRTKLAATAKKRGDTDTAKRISAARKPTTAAWVVNRLAHSNVDATRSLIDLGERLRSAHAAMDGPAIRELSAEQRSLVDELARAAFEGAEVTNPSATLREDVTGNAAGRSRRPRCRRPARPPDQGRTVVGLRRFRRDHSGGHHRAHRARPNPKPSRHGSNPHASGAATNPARRPKSWRRRRRRWPPPSEPKTDADRELSDRQTDLAVARLRRDEMRQRLERRSATSALPTRLTARPSRPAMTRRSWSRTRRRG